MRTIAFIFARGGSKGIPGKNIKEICGKPLLAYAIEIAQQIESIEEIFVSTEDDKIAAVAKEFGAGLISRPIALAQDDSPEWSAWQHAVKWLEERGVNFDIFVSLPPTSPLRNKRDVTQCLTSFSEGADLVVGITEAARSPWFNMVHKKDNDFIEVLLKSDNSYARRQETPTIFDMTTVAYVSRPEFIKQANGIFDGRVKGVEIPAERALDIDTELDFQIAEFLMNKAKKSNMDNTGA
jgi:N-acylneuraminate cytidylyltransferase